MNTYGGGIMQFELGGLIAAGVAILGAFTTALMYAFNASSTANHAIKKSDEATSRSDERYKELVRAILDLRTKQDEHYGKMVDGFSSIEKALARLQGRLETNIDSRES